MNDLITKIESTLRNDIEAIQKPSPRIVLESFIQNQHDTDGQRWAQSTLELQNRLFSLKRAEISDRKMVRKIEYLEVIARGETPDREARRMGDAADDAELAKLDREEMRLAALGAAREAVDLMELRKAFGRSWTREQLDQEAPEYYRRRAIRQATMDINATGRIGVGNQDMLRQLGMSVPGLPGYIPEVEQRYLEFGKTKILVAVPTLIPKPEILEKGLRCLDGWSLPNTVNQKLYVIDGRPVSDAYNEAARVALQDGCTHMLTVEDDHIIPQGSFERLWALWQQAGPRAIVGAWYPQKKEPRVGAPIVLQNGHRDYLTDDGAVHEVYTVPQGFTLIPMSVFNDVPHPWFATTGCLTQDSFFSQVAREAGHRLLVDTSVRISHVCRETGRVYE